MDGTRKGNGAGAIPEAPPIAHPADGEPDGAHEVDTAVHPAIPDDWRLAELEASLMERDAQLAEAERAIAEAAGQLRRRALRKVLEGREALAEAHARLEREVARAILLEAEIDRQISLREAESAEAEQRFRQLEAQARREIAEAKGAGERAAASAQADLERTRTAAAADIERARAGFEEKRQRLEVALEDTRAAVDEARERLEQERASRAGAEERLAAAIDGEAAAAREAASQRREFELSESELERLREERTKLRSELAAAEVRAREAGESAAVQARPETGSQPETEPQLDTGQADTGQAGTGSKPDAARQAAGSQPAERHGHGGADSVVDEAGPPTEAPRRRFGRSKHTAAKLQEELRGAQAAARAEMERAAGLEEQLERAFATERALRADLERLNGQRSSGRGLMRGRPSTSRESGSSPQSAAGRVRAGLLARIRSRAKRAP